MNTKAGCNNCGMIFDYPEIDLTELLDPAAPDPEITCPGCGSDEIVDYDPRSEEGGKA